ncbi:Linear gramicidin synthase subunit C [Includes: ATP-dependent valine adenylase (ValA) (Valine activase), partial [Durusdinium trenchii]
MSLDTRPQGSEAARQAVALEEEEERRRGVLPVVRLVTQSDASLDAERLEECFRHAAERQKIPRGTAVDFAVVQVAEDEDPTKQVEAVLGDSIEWKVLVMARLLRSQSSAAQDVLAVAALRSRIDPLSLCLFMSDVKLLYESTSRLELPAVEVSFDEFKMWREDQLMSGDAFQQQLAYWQVHLAKPLPSLELPCDAPYYVQDKPRAKDIPMYLETVPLELPGQLCDKVRSFCMEHHVSPRAMLLAAFHLLISRYTGECDVIVGCHVDNRGRHVEAKGVVGAFENWIPVRVVSGDHPSARAFVERVARALSEAEDNVDVPLEALKKELGVPQVFAAGFEVYGNSVDEYSFPLITTRLLRMVIGVASRSLGAASSTEAPLSPPSAGLPKSAMDNILAGTASQGGSTTGAHSHGPGRGKPLSMGGISLHSLPLTTGCDLRDDRVRLVGVTSPVMRLALQVDVNSFSTEAIRRMAKHMTNLLENLLEGFQVQRLSDVEMMDDLERDMVVSHFNKGKTDRSLEDAADQDGLETSLLVPDLVERQASRSPENLAVSIHNGRATMTYRQLDAKANQLANFLLLSGATLGEPVPVLLNRSLDLAVAWLAVLKSGAAVMPMDPKFPVERVGVMLEDANAAIVVTEEALLDSLPATWSGRTVVLDKDWSRAIQFGSFSPPRVTLDPKSPAYVIYTSGSTGQPKGVVLEHRAIVNYVQWHLKYYEMCPQDRVFACAGLAFDASMADTWPTFCAGACLLPVVDSDIIVVPRRFWDWVVRERATMGFLTTQLCEMVLAEDERNPRDDLGKFRLLYTGGDRLHFGARADAPFTLVNIYGPTENTINSTMTHVEPGLRNPPSIGSPAPNTQCYVVDPDTLRPVPIGVYGELLVAGAQLARGYLKREALTAAKFIPNPIPGTKGDRVYRTGDLVRWRADGMLDFWGRKDSQVKIRGNRVELSAIECKLISHPAVQDAVVVAREDVPGYKRLVGYLVLEIAQDNNCKADASALKDTKREVLEYLESKLPGFMIPSALVVLPEFPLTSNHKVDRRALPPPTATTGVQGEASSESNLPRKGFLKRRQGSLLGSFDQGNPLDGHASEIFAQVLGLSGETENQGKADVHFFESGGDSLGAGQVTAMMSQLVGAELPVSLLYKFPTVSRYCRAVAVAQAGVKPPPVRLDGAVDSADDTQHHNTAHRLPDVKGEEKGDKRDGLPIVEEETSAKQRPGEADIQERRASFNEESLWLVCQNPNEWASRAYNVPFSCKCPAETFEPEALEKALLEVSSTFEALRVRFRAATQSGEALVERVLEESATLDFAVTQGLTNEDEVLKEWLGRETYKTFDLSKGPLCRVRLAQLENKQGQVLLVVLHHIVTDLWSMVIFLDKLFAAYFDGEHPGKPERDYSSFVVMQRGLVRGARGESLLKYWRKALADDHSDMELPLDFPRPANKSFRGGAHRFRVDRPTSLRLRQMCSDTGFTMNVLLLTAFNVLLRGLTGKSSVRVGVPTAGRYREDLAAMVGYFVNPVVLQNDLSGNPTLVQLLNRVSTNVLLGIDHQAMPLPYLVDQLGCGTNRQLFNIAYVFQRPFRMRKGLTECLLGFDGAEVDIHPKVAGAVSLTSPHQHAQFDLTLMVFFENDQVSGVFHYCTDILKSSSVESFANMFCTLLQGMSDCNPESTRLGDLPLVGLEERAKVLNSFNRSHDEYRPRQDDGLSCIHHLVEAQAQRTPHRISVSAEGVNLSYRKLDERSNRLANFLRFAGVQHEVQVPVLLDRGADLVVSWLAVLKAGGAVMPMDPKFPTERLRAVLQEASACIILTEVKHAARVSEACDPSTRVVTLDADWDDVIALASCARPANVEEQSDRTLAYVIYTSGSTGRPKGVMLEHRSIVNYIRWHIQYYKMTSEDRVFSCAGLAFDASMADTWPTLCIGACLLPVVNPDVAVVPPRLLDWIAEARATMGFLTTQICEMVLEEEHGQPRGDLECLRLLYTGGDRLHFGPPRDASYQLVNIYGPTENTINSTMCYVEKGTRVPPPIGFPAPNTFCFVLDAETMVPLPVGVFGELFLGGVQLARGYFKQPNLTKQAFVENPFESEVQGSGSTLYRTGDLVRWLPDGQIEFLGRRDTQVKIRGNRVELTSIETTLLQYPDIKDAVVVAKPRGLQDKVLVAYLISNIKLDVSIVKAFLKGRLPSFMVPSLFMQLEQFPLTANHKVNRNALPDPTASSAGTSNRSLSPKGRAAVPVQARNTLHESIREMLAAALGKSVTDIKDDDDFFDLGGHSLSAARIMSKVRSQFELDMPLSRFLTKPTVQGVASFVERSLSATSSVAMSPGSGRDATSKVKLFSESSVVSSSYRSSEITQWLLVNKKRADTARDSSARKPPLSGTPFRPSSMLRQAREQSSSAQTGRQQPSSKEANRAQSVAQRMISESPLTVAHSPIWRGSIPRTARSGQDRSLVKPKLGVLSYNQQSLWFLHKMDPSRVDFVVHVCCELDTGSTTGSTSTRGQREEFSAQILTEALQELVDRHESLRTLYGEENGVPFQLVYPPASTHKASKAPNAVNVLTHQNLSDEALEHKVQQHLHAPWDLHHKAPFRAHLYLRRSGESPVLLLLAHHIALDGWSLDVLLEDLGEAYDRCLARSRGDDVTKEWLDATGASESAKEMTVLEYAWLQKEEIGGATGDRLWNFWQRQLAGHEAMLDLPTDNEEGAGFDKRCDGKWFSFEVDKADLVDLQQVIKLERGTLFMALLAFYAGLLHRYSGKEDILIGTPMACRTRPELDRTVGNITNVVVLRMHVSKEDNFRSLLRQARAVVLSAFEHQELPFAVLVERMETHRQSGQNPLFQVLLSLNQPFSTHKEADEAPSLARLETGETVMLGSNLKAREFAAEQQASPYDLQLIFSQGQESLRASFQYKPSRFSDDSIRRMAAHFCALVRRSAENPKQMICHMPLLSAEEMTQMVVQWNETEQPFEAEVCVHQLFEEAAANFPFRVAVSFQGHMWSYGDLNRRANILARYLRHKCHVQPSMKVGILLERSPEMILAMLAVAKSGGAYVPMSTAWPAERLIYVFEDSAMQVVLCNHQMEPLLSSMAAERLPMLLVLDRTWPRIARRVAVAFGEERAESNLPPPSSMSWGRDAQQWHGSRSVVYMIYTSGSTGNPKGVLIEHCSLVNLVQWHRREYSLTPADRASQLVGAAFDPVALEVWPFLSVGASVHVVDDQTRDNLTSLRQWLQDERISVCLLPTPLLEMFLKLGRRGIWPSCMRVMYGGGDKLHVAAETLAELPFRLDNHYGPSEGTVMCTFYNLARLDVPEGGFSTKVLSPYIGKPISNFKAFVLDGFLQPVPALVAGELCIAGPGLARGYLERPQLTAERFVPLPEALKEELGSPCDSALREDLWGRLYRTGDRVRFRRDGNIEFIGRVDFQVKIRGMRVELGEIESVLKQHGEVLEACVVAREDKPGQQRLCAYVVWGRHHELTSKSGEGSQVEVIHELQNLVKDKLPSYMVPVAWVFVEDQLPQTPNGKIDRKALPPPSDDSKDAHGKALRAVVSPRTGTEVALAKLWQETLALEEISVHDNFFDLGGHSLAATQLLSMVHEVFSAEISITAFFADPSVAGMARALSSVRAGTRAGPENVPRDAAEQAGGTADVRGDFDDDVGPLGFDPREEVQLDASIKPLRRWDPFCEIGEAKNDSWRTCFLTGATGFLGSFLVHKLCDNLRHLDPPGQLICLVRGKTDAEALARLRESLKSFELLSDVEDLGLGIFDGVTRMPVSLVRGDLSLPFFGLSRSVFEHLADQAEVTIHAGAFVHSLFPYSRLQAANVGGTKEVLRLACSRDPALEPMLVVHVSTLSVFAGSPPDGAFAVVQPGVCDVQDEPVREVLWAAEGPLTSEENLHLLEGYAQTKWVAEHLVREAQRRGVGATIFRPGRITGDSNTGIASFGDFMCLFLKGCLQIQAAPDLDWVMDTNPVDLVCDGVVELCRRPRAEVIGRAFNLCHPQPQLLPEYMSWVQDEMGFHCPVIPYKEWRERLVRAAKSTTDSSNALYPLLPMFAADRDSMQPQEQLRFEPSLPELTARYPPLETLHRVALERMIRDGFVPPPASDSADQAFFDTRRIPMELTDVPETTLWTLWNRASEVRPGGLTEGDEACLRIRDQLMAEGVDFESKFGEANNSHAIRSRMFDDAVATVAREAEKASRRVVVVSLGEGLETQRFRLESRLPDNTPWVTVDLPETIAIRERFIQPDSMHVHVPVSAADVEGWATRTLQVAGQPAEALTVIVIAGGLFMYLEEEVVQQTIVKIRERFPHGSLVFDLISPNLSSKTMSENGWRLTPNYVTPRMPFGILFDDVTPRFQSWLGTPTADVEHLPWRLEPLMRAAVCCPAGTCHRNSQAGVERSRGAGEVARAAMSVFVSCSRGKDLEGRDTGERGQELAKVLREDLQLTTWFGWEDAETDEDALFEVVKEGVGNADVALVCVTKEYMDLVNNNRKDSMVKMEFIAIMTQMPRANVVLVALEPFMLERSSWFGRFGEELSTMPLHLDMSDSYLDAGLLAGNLNLRELVRTSSRETGRTSGKPERDDEERDGDDFVQLDRAKHTATIGSGRKVLSMAEIQELAFEEIGKDEVVRVLKGAQLVKLGRTGRANSRQVFVNGFLTHLAWESSRGNTRGVKFANVVEIAAGLSPAAFRKRSFRAKDFTKAKDLCFHVETHERS